MVVSSVSPERCDTTADQPAARQLDRLDRLGERADLVQLDQDRVRRVELDGLGDPLGVRDQQIVADQLDPVAEPLAQVLPARPVVLAEAVLERHDGIAVNPVGPQVDELAAVECGPPGRGRIGPPEPPLASSTSSEVAGSSAIAIWSPAWYPARSTARRITSSAASFDGSDGAKPALVALAGGEPSSWRIERSAPKISAPARRAGEYAPPTGITMNSWKSVESWACLPLEEVVDRIGSVRAPTPPR